MVMGLTARVWHLLCLGSSQSFSITDVHPGHLHLEFSICKKKKKKMFYFVELNKSRERVEKWNVDHSKSDRMVRELRARVDDLTEAVGAKDSQLAVLKVRLQEADQLLSSRTEALEALQSEKSRYVIISDFMTLQIVVSFKIQGRIVSLRIKMTKLMWADCIKF